MESPAAPLGDFCTESLFRKDFDFAHLLCWSGCTLRRLLHGESGCTLRRLLHEESFWKRLRFLRTCCAGPVVPLGDFCAECRTRG
jgi:hypothetical protein